MSNPQRGTVLEWDSRRGFGFLDHGGTRLFLHRRDCAAGHQAPIRGDVVSFRVGRDARGRPCAQQAETVSSRSRLQVSHFMALLVLLFLPTLAALKGPFDPRIVAGYAAVLSILAWSAYRSDKTRALAGAWRIPESTLHTLALLGGWPGAFLAQKHLRHKTSKASFQCRFWLVVGLYQCVAFDYLADWRFSKALGAAVKALVQ